MKMIIKARFATAFALALAACGGGAADPGAARERVSSTIPNLLDQTDRGFTAVSQTNIWQSYQASATSVNDSFAGVPISMPFATTTTVASKLGVYAVPGEETFGQAFARFLNEKVFTEANYEGDGVYRLHGADFCPVDETTGVVDATCVANFDAAEIRVRANLAGDGLDITLIIGPERSEPLTIELRSNSITLVVDLAETKEALQQLASISGSTIDLPAVMEGVVAFSLTLNGEQDVTIAAAIREAVRIQGTYADGRSYSFSSAVADPYASVRVQGLQQKLTIDLDIGATALSMPWNVMNSLSPVTGQYNLDLKGFSSSVVLDGSTSLLEITHIGFGDGQTTLKLDDQLLFALDLNPSSGRHFDLSIADDPAALPIFSFDPEMDLTLQYHMAPLAAAGETVDSYLLDETYHIAFTNGPSAQPIAGDPMTGAPGALKILAGQLSISSTAAASPIVVNAGQCLLPDAVTTGEHPILGALTAGACP